MKRRKSLGQCFLEDKNILNLEVKLADVKGKRVLEIGAGDGRLTDAILKAAPESIVAVEKDPFYASELRQRFKDKDVDIVESDFLAMDIPKVDVILGNIPYYISSDIIFSLINVDFERAVLMVQKEFARKMVAEPGDSNYGRLSVTSQLYYEVKLERTVLRHLFRPAPKVDSAIIILTPRGITLTQFQENLIRYLFQHKNKTVRNALIDSKMFDQEELDSLGPFAKKRARNLSKEEILGLARILQA
jgi:16S rRNA (adenine1518-N6/adenine1519-N6)-dimethyltransferase